MLEFWILNVGRGDSVVIKYTDEQSNNSFFGVIDSNLNQGENKPKALLKLKALGATHLSFIALTHPHLDHYLGMSQIMEEFTFSKFYSFPLKIEDAKKLANIAKKATSTTDKNINKNAIEFIKILHKACSIKDSWEPCSGLKSQVYPDGFSDVEIISILPTPNEKGQFFNLISAENPNLSLLTGNHPNDISLAFSVKYAGITTILGGDASKRNWDEHRFILRKNKIDNLDATIYKLPHHGSIADNDTQTIDYIYKQQEDPTNNIAIISAIGGNHHPHADVLKIISEKNIQPYCTNLAKSCGGGGDIRLFKKIETLSNPLNSLISANIVNNSKQTQPCQGDIHIKINRNGEINISTELDNICWYRKNPLSTYI